MAKVKLAGEMITNEAKAFCDIVCVLHCNALIGVWCVTCPMNKNGQCEKHNKPVPKLKQSAIEWPKEMLQ